MKNQNIRGMTLIQVVIGTMLTGLIVYFSMQSMKQINDGISSGQKETDIANAIRNVGITLKVKLEGTKSFQNLGFDSTYGSSAGAGFYVAPDRDWAGNSLVGTSSAGNDLMFLVAAQPMRTQLKLDQSFTTTDSTFTLKAEDASIKISDMVAAGDTLVFSTSTASEVITAVGTIPNTNVGALTIDPVNSYVNTFAITGSTTPRRQNLGYVKNDYVYKADILRLGIDLASKELRLGKSTTDYLVIGRNVGNFFVEYNLKDSTVLCPTISTAASANPNDLTYSRANWNELNTQSNNLCYSRLRAVRLNYLLGDKKANYSFFTNN